VIKLNDQVKNDFMFHSGLILSSTGGIGKDFESDGIVSAYEVMSLDLNRTDLVVLSACETGLGKVEYSEGVYGLQRAFLQAGADNIMISLWKVEDMMTKDLMIKFYSYLGKQHNEHDAFKLAQLDMMHSVANPRLWGGFVMVSDN
jgi:CHAT domain-containing protein